MTYDGVMVMPRNCMAMTTDEMTYVEGGLQLYVNVAMLARPYCLALGATYAGTAGLSAGRIAAEIYAHARLYYGSVAVAALAGAAAQSLSAVSTAINYIRTHSNPIDIGNDSAARVAVYNAMWLFF